MDINKIIEVFVANPLGAILALISVGLFLYILYLIRKMDSKVKIDTEEAKAKATVSSDRAQADLLAAKEKYEMSSRLMDFQAKQQEVTNTEFKSMAKSMERIATSVDRSLDEAENRTRVVTDALALATEAMVKIPDNLSIFKTALEAHTNSTNASLSKLGSQVDGMIRRLDFVAGQHNTIVGIMREVASTTHVSIIDDVKTLLQPKEEPKKEADNITPASG